ncbi:hypothetical protein MNBD_GAMMA12-3237 [hydrothermal vent metagenome]|uniref:Uncharacterized protein n=1 Tax=hydrothermal vent metagenome TaxID=652676 RepID=A0A3B0YS81_9ZZZZ
MSIFFQKKSKYFGLLSINISMPAPMYALVNSSADLKYQGPNSILRSELIKSTLASSSENGYH